MFGITIAMIVSIILNGGVEPKELAEVGFYPESAVVMEIKDSPTLEDTSEIYVMCFNGNRFMFTCEDSDYIEGDLVAMMMCDNGTKDSVYDDIIVSAKYGGWVYEWGYDDNYVIFDND